MIVQLAALAGLRRDEIARVQWADISNESLWIIGKGGRSRSVPLPMCLIEDLNAEHRRRLYGLIGDGWRYSVDATSPYLLPGIRGGHMSADTVGAILGRLLGPGWSGHKLRHRYATRVYEGSRDLLATQQLLGHSRPETTQRYVAVSSAALREAASAAWAGRTELP